MKRAIRYIPLAIGLALAGSAFANVTFYERKNFAGRELSVNQSVSNFEGTGFNDRARSAVVNSGQWEVCVDAGFNGDCQVLGPGRYQELGGISGRISSVRPVSSAATLGRASEGYGQPRHGNDKRANVTLYEGANLTGRTFSFADGNMSNLDRTGFNDRASSLKVERGYWMFCSDANFGGECRTFGPGEYASLPRGLNDRISSGRRISDEYPYSQSPNWQR
jgi:hypothetical protein